MRRRITRRLPGAAAVELALILPFLMYLFVIGADWARLFHYTITLDACARAGALYAADPVGAAQSPYPSLQDAAVAEAPDFTPKPTVTSFPTVDAAGNPAVVVTATVPFTTLTNLPGGPTSCTLARSVQMRIAPLKTN